MRILFVIHQFFPEFLGGTERVAFNIARMAQRAGHHVHFLACAVEPEKYAALVRPYEETKVNSRLASSNPVALNTPGAFECVVQGLPVTLLSRAKLPVGADISLEADESLVVSLMDWMQQQNFDLAHVMHTMRMGSAMQAIQRCGLPYVFTLTDFFLPCARITLLNLEGQICSGPDRGRRCINDCSVPAWPPAAYLGRFAQSKAVLEGASARIAPSEYVAGRFREAFEGLDVQVITHGMDLLAINSGVTPVTKPEAKPLPTADEKSPLRLIFIGSIIAQKGLDVLLRAFALLPPRANVLLTVVGGFYGDPAYRHEIERLAANDKRITFAGPLEPARVFGLLAQSDAFCLPSLMPEPFALVLHESAAAGVPALVSDVGAPPHVVRQHGCGVVVPAGNAAAWAEAIAGLLAEPERLQEYKRNLFLPLRIEEEAFFYESIWRQCRQVVTA